MGAKDERLKAIMNRLGVLEAALGIDTPLAEECTGDRATCVGACRSGACPMETHALTRLEKSVRIIEENHEILRNVFLEMEAAQVVPREIWARAVARAEMERLEGRLADVTRMLEEITESGIVGPLLDEATRRKVAVEEAVRRARQTPPRGPAC